MGGMRRARPTAVGVAVLTVLGFATREASGACPNLCSGHGDCNIYSRCDCWDEWTGGDCSERECNHPPTHSPPSQQPQSPRSRTPAHQMMLAMETWPLTHHLPLSHQRPTRLAVTRRGRSTTTDPTTRSAGLTHRQPTIANIRSCPSHTNTQGSVRLVWRGLMTRRVMMRRMRRLSVLIGVSAPAPLENARVWRASVARCATGPPPTTL